LTPFYLRFEEQVKKEFKKSSEKEKELEELDSEKCANEKCCKNCESSKNVVEGKKKKIKQLPNHQIFINKFILKLDC
jgi:hypothetical protein